jgi:hypothetical protein
MLSFPMCNCTSEDAPLGADPESILPIVVMDCGLTRFTRAPYVTSDQVSFCIDQ